MKRNFTLAIALVLSDFCRDNQPACGFSSVPSNGNLFRPDNVQYVTSPRLAENGDVVAVVALKLPEEGNNFTLIDSNQGGVPASVLQASLEKEAVKSQIKDFTGLAIQTVAPQVGIVTTAAPTTTTKSDSGLSSGAKAGIAVACIGLIVIIVVLGVISTKYGKMPAARNIKVQPRGDNVELVRAEKKMNAWQ